MDCATWKYANLLFISLGVSRACIQGSQAALPTEDILHCLFIGIERRGKILLLLFYMIQRLIDLILLPFHGCNMAEQSGQLQDKLAPRSHSNEILSAPYAFAIVYQGTIPDSDLACKSVEVTDVRLEFVGPAVDDFFDGFASEHRWGWNSNSGACVAWCCGTSTRSRSRRSFMRVSPRSTEDK